MADRIEVKTLGTTVINGVEYQNETILAAADQIRDRAGFSKLEEDRRVLYEINRLPPALADVFLLLVQGYRNQEILPLVGISSSILSTRLGRIREIFRAKNDRELLTAVLPAMLRTNHRYLSGD